METSDEDFIDGKIVVGLKVFEDKVYCDYDRIYMQSQNGAQIQLIAICWNKHGYEDDNLMNQRLKSLPILPLGVAKPVRKEYNLDNQCLPFKVALYKYVQSILNFSETFVTIDRNIAKVLCLFEEHFQLYGNIYEMMNSANPKAILRNVHYKNDIECFNVRPAIESHSIDDQQSTSKYQHINYEAAENYRMGMTCYNAGNYNVAKFFFKKAASLGYTYAEDMLNKLESIR